MHAVQALPSPGRALDLGRPGKSKTVMIVEDNELNMKLFHDLLEAHGYHPIGTRDGIEALDLARKVCSCLQETHSIPPARKRAGYVDS